MDRILMNPLNLRYQYQHYNNQASREAADPTLILFKGRYYMFASMSGGFYWSEDLLHWNWHENRDLTPFRYAPDVRQVGKWLVFSSSDRDPSAFYRTEDPMSDAFEKVSEPFPFWDPDLFQDDDGRVYFYWGCDNQKPIYGQEFDPETLLPIGERRELIFGNTAEHGWERPNYPGRPKEQGKEGLAMRLYRLLMRLNGSDKKPFVEGPFMSKVNGRYYLQYAAPGTELATYGDGAYVGDGPLGPFTYQAHNPFSSKPGGFITGAGHGSTIEDAYGNLWHASTMRISVNANFERRVGLFPTGVDQDGILFCNQNFADYPLEIPEGSFDPWSVQPRWLLEGSTDGATWTVLADKRDVDSDLSHDYIPLDGVSLRYLRVTATALPYNEPFALSGLRVFGRGDCDAPDPVKQVMVTRPDPMTARLDWSASRHAIGYNIRYGIAPDKLYSSHMVYGDSHVLLTMLNAGQPYYAAVDAFGEGGITAGEIIPIECA